MFHWNFTLIIFWLRIKSRGRCLSVEPSLSGSESKVVALGVRTTAHHWHARFGHPSRRTSSIILSKFHLVVLNTSDVLTDDCVSCNVSKTHRLPFSDSSFIASHPLEYLYADVWAYAYCFC